MIKSAQNWSQPAPFLMVKRTLVAAGATTFFKKAIKAIKIGHAHNVEVGSGCRKAPLLCRVSFLMFKHSTTPLLHTN
jgi:multidrug transporter EmrE-like cation transporter